MHGVSAMVVATVLAGLTWPHKQHFHGYRSGMLSETETGRREGSGLRREVLELVWRKIGFLGMDLEGLGFFFWSDVGLEEVLKMNKRRRENRELYSIVRGEEAGAGDR